MREYLGATIRRFRPTSAVFTEECTTFLSVCTSLLQVNEFFRIACPTMVQARSALVAYKD